MEKFLLCAVFACDELDIVDEEQICEAVFVTEFLYLTFADGVNQFVGEVFAFDIDDAERRMVAAHDGGDGVQKVGFSQTGLAVNKQWVVVFGRIIGDGGRSGVCEFVG